MIKFVDRLDLKAKIILGYNLLPTGVHKLVTEQLQEDSEGIRIDTRELSSLIYTNLETNLNPELTQYFKGDLEVVVRDDLPEVEPDTPDTPDGPIVPVTPSSNVIKIINTGKKMSWNSELFDKFVFPNCGPDYTSKPFKLIFADENELPVKNPSKMTMTPDNMKYQPGGRWSGNDPNIPTMEVYARRGTHPAWVEAVFQHKVDPTPIPQPIIDPGIGGWTKIMWAGHPTNHDSRKWWTDIHGRDPGEAHKWWRCWRLPAGLDRTKKVIDFRFSDGTTFTVYDSQKMAMRPNGPKYQIAEYHDPNPDKRSPKISEMYGANATWMEYKVR